MIVRMTSAPKDGDGVADGGVDLLCDPVVCPLLVAAMPCVE